MSDTPKWLSDLPPHVREAIHATADARCGRCGTREAESYGQSVQFGMICHRCALLELLGPDGDLHPSLPPEPRDVAAGTAECAAAATAPSGASATQAARPSAPGVCASCGAVGGPVRACAGTCGGSASYCNRECQVAHRAVHGRKCWKRAPTDTLTIPNPRGGKPDVPVKAYHQLDGFDRSGLSLYYSDHLGEEITRPHVVSYFGEVDDEMGWNSRGLTSMLWCNVTNPVHDEDDRRALKHGEAVFNTDKHPREVEALLREGIIKDTGRTVQIGYYDPHPVCRINLPVHVREDEHGEEAENED